MEVMPEGFYVAKEITLFDRENTIYVYPSGDETYGMCIETGDFSCFWDMSQFKYAENQDQMKQTYRHLLPSIE